MQDTFAITRLLDTLFGGPVSSLQHAVGLQTTPETAFTNSFALEMLVTLGLILFFVLVRVSLSVESPNAAQQVAEMVHEGIGSQSEQIIGHEYERFQSFVVCIFLFVLLNNLIGAIPGIPAPTSHPVVPLGLAVLTFLYYNFHGIRAQGPIGYIKHFAGPVWWMAWLIFPIEIISHLARVLSLTIRLYANMFASDLVTLVFFSLIPVAVPAIFIGLHVAVSVIQAFVFMLLTMIYLSLATAHDH
ncbi:MAG TPA: F0F1 ATP synthase subunit A [Terracidiphilus sp.]|jgi:F-type H+-transporting ATPase subunit a|nr:F0F1 ATP synthase subunit A [Terracidiphilus sp.]